MGIKKLKKKLKKQLEKVKDYLQDQARYLQDLKEAAKNTIFLTIKFTALFSFILVSTISANYVHLGYIEDKIGDSTVFIRSPEGAKIQGSGTGFEVKAPSGKVYTLTNAHVCGLSKDGVIMVGEKLNSRRLVPKRVLEVYQENDLCLIEGLEGYKGLSLASDIEVGQSVWAVGYPLGQALNISSGRVKSFQNVAISDEDTSIEDCTGPHQKIMHLNTLFGPIDVCTIQRYAAQTDVPTYPGNSGSPLVNIYGNVVGVIFAANNQTHWGEAVPLSYVQDLLKAY